MTTGKSNDPIGDGIKDSCEPHHMVAKKRIKVLSKNIMYSKQMSYLQPFQIFYLIYCFCCVFTYMPVHLYGC